MLRGESRQLRNDFKRIFLGFLLFLLQTIKCIQVKQANATTKQTDDCKQDEFKQISASLCHGVFNKCFALSCGYELDLVIVHSLSW